MQRKGKVKDVSCLVRCHKTCKNCTFHFSVVMQTLFSFSYKKNAKELAFKEKVNGVSDSCSRK